MTRFWLAFVCVLASAQDLFIFDTLAPEKVVSVPSKASTGVVVKSFTIHVIHHPQDPQSVIAKDSLRLRFCDRFAIYPCVATPGKDERVLHLIDDFVVNAPFDNFHDVVTFFQQHRIARLNPPAKVDLDLMVHPNTIAGTIEDLKFAIWAGNKYPVDMNAVYRKQMSDSKTEHIGVALATSDVDSWAYSCSYDASGKGDWVDLCSKGPYAFNTTCRATPVGAHIHFYYSDANGDETSAKEVFMGMATKALNLSLDICHDNYGHEQPHNNTCWLGGPTHMPPHMEKLEPPAGSFVKSTFSLYVSNRDFAKVVSWVMLNDLSEIIGESFDFLLHPVFGCNFADHQMWSLHKGSTPNNLYGIEQEGGWTGSLPSRLDPFGPEASAPCACSAVKVLDYSLHIPYDPTDKREMAAKEILVGKLKRAFDKSIVQFVEDIPFSYKHRTSPFLAGQAHFKIRAESYAEVLAWLAVERGSTDVLLVPTTCCGQRWDYTESAIWAGRRWPLNDAALETNVAASHSFSNQFLQRDISVKKSAATQAFVLYVCYAAANLYQVAAVKKFNSLLADEFNLAHSKCATQSSASEPSYDKLCVMNKIATPGVSDLVTSAYVAIFVPARDAARVLSWAALHRGAKSCGYQVDLLMVPLTGDILADYTDHALHVGIDWPVNNAALLVASSSGETRALTLPNAVHYYREDNVDQYSKSHDGVAIQRWNVERNFQSDWPLAPPYIARYNIPAGATFPSWGSYWLEGDSYSTVISGNATFGEDDKVYGYGDLFWAMGGHSHGPIKNVGNSTLIVTVVSTGPLLLRHTHDAPSDANPSVIARLKTSRGYRRVDGNWRENPSPHTDECLANGGVQNMMFDALNNTVPVLRVKWAPHCSIPYHYHPTGALYFIQYGKMFFRGDLSKGGEDIAFTAGEVRWVRPGFDYGPEYNSKDEPMEITVLGTDTPPMFEAPPPGPYKYQKTSTFTAVFDEL